MAYSLQLSESRIQFDPSHPYCSQWGLPGIFERAQVWGGGFAGMNASQAWQTVKSQLQQEMSKAAFDTWVSNAELVSVQEDAFTIGVRNSYGRDWLEHRLSSRVAQMLSEQTGAPQTVRFVVFQSNVSSPSALHSLSTESLDHSHDSLFHRHMVNNRFTFDNFIVGSSNRMVYAAARAIIENPASSYNPLFIYGGVGLGKTHILHAIGNAALQRKMQVLYITSEEFTNDLIEAIRTQSTAAFRSRYRRLDILLVDDIQFIANRESTQVEFFHTFNALYGENKQIVMTSDRPPKAMNTLEDRLRSRFTGGLIADIRPPDLDMRIAILRSKAQRSQTPVPQEILEIIAGKIHSNIRELEGALTRVLAFADLIGQPITPELVHFSLTDLQTDNGKNI